MLFAPLTKISEQSDGSLLVGGYASTCAMDSDGEIIPDEVVKAALPDYLKFPTIRTMHRPNPVGKTVYAKQDSKGTFIEGRVYDEDTKKLIKSGVLRAFSIGGGVLARDNKNPKVIRKIRLSEISLVDSPANKQCEITMWKRGKEPDLDRNIVRKIQSRKPMMFNDILNKGNVENEPRDSSGRWTDSGSHSLPVNTGNSGSGSNHGNSNEPVTPKGVVLEDRGQRRGRPWGSIAGAVGAGLLGAAVAARNPSRLAAILAGAAAHGVAGGVKGAIRGAGAQGASWPVKAALAAGRGVIGAGAGALHGMGRAEARPRLYNALAGGLVAGAAGAGVGGAVGEAAGGMHDRAFTTRLVDLNEKSAKSVDLIKSVLSPHQRIAALARGRIANPKAPPPAARIDTTEPTGNRVPGPGGVVGGAGIAKAEHPFVQLAKLGNPDFGKAAETSFRSCSGAQS